LRGTDVFSDGTIAAVGDTLYIRGLWKDDDFKKIIDATGKCVLPGFVDAHTHPVWAGDRVNEFAMKVEFLCNIINFHSFVHSFIHVFHIYNHCT
jgi:imidazolonepropionase-like amidohydrolase